MRKFDIGDTVLCWLWNTPEKRYYGYQWVGKIINTKPLMVTKEHHPGGIRLDRKEIIRRVARESK